MVSATVAVARDEKRIEHRAPTATHRDLGPVGQRHAFAPMHLPDSAAAGIALSALGIP